MSTPTHICATCRWWIRGRILIENRGELPGQCRRNPPLARSTWPSTDSGDWCGEHSKLSEVADKAAGHEPTATPTARGDDTPQSTATAAPDDKRPGATPAAKADAARPTTPTRNRGRQ